MERCNNIIQVHVMERTQVNTKVCLFTRTHDEEKRLAAYRDATTVSCPRKCQNLKEEFLLENPVMRKQMPQVCSSYSAVKDPCNCPTLLFHEDKKVKYMALLLREPVVVWPLRDEAMCSTIEEFEKWVQWKQPHSFKNKAFKFIVQHMLGKMLSTVFKYLNKIHKELDTNKQTITEAEIR